MSRSWSKNVGLAVGISLRTHSIPEIQCTSGLQYAILNLGSRPTSGNVGSVTSDSGVVENVGLAVGILLITHSIPEIQCTSGSQSALFNSASQPSSCSVNQ